MLDPIAGPAIANPDRRAFITSGAALLLAVTLPVGGRRAHAAAVDFAPNAFIRIDQNGGIRLIMRDVEMGQGIWTGASMLLAEELDVALDQVAAEFAPPDEKLYTSPLLGLQATGGSTSIRGDWESLRKAGAIARAALVQAAARQWNVEPASCGVKRAVVTHTASGRIATYASLVPMAASQPLPTDAPLKDRKDWTLIGTSQRRLDTKDKTNGTTVYGIDVQVPGMKIAVVAICPVLGGTLGTVDDRRTLAIPGVLDVVKTEHGVAVVGDHFWAAKKGLDALVIEWTLGANAAVSQADIVKGHEQASLGEGLVAKERGTAAASIAAAPVKVEAVYQLPFLAHATMEPINCTVHVRPDAVDVWCGTQVPTRARDEAAKATGISSDRVAVHNHMIGGGFGRRLEAEYVGIAASFARQVPYPLKMVWTRETDIQHDRYRPYYFDRISAGLDGDGNIVGWTHKTTASSVMARWAPPAMRANGIDPDTVEGAEDLLYDVGALRVSWVRYEPPGLVTAWWRGVGPAHNTFVVESFVDELAHVAGKDPVAFRRALLSKAPRALNVLEIAARESGWGTPLPAGCGRGIIVQYAFGSFISVVCEVRLEGEDIRLRRLTVALDCGLAINPDSVRAQIEGGLIFGLSAALYGEITFAEGRVQQTNFNDYRVLRMDEVPPIDIHVVPSVEKPGGLGEVGTAAAFPALANAVFAVTGKRLRRLPLVDSHATAS